MRMLAAAIAALTLAVVGLATHIATSDTPADAGITQKSDRASGSTHLLLPYIEQENVFRSM